jgi:hypothetical protein
MWSLPLIIALSIGALLALLLLADWRTTGYVRRLWQAKPRPPELIDLAAESPDALDDNRPTWLLLTRATPSWNADQVAERCARLWHVPVNQHEHDVNFVIGEAPCLMLRHADWHYLLTVGDEPYMDPEQIPETADQRLRQAFAAQQSWFSLSVVGTPDDQSLGSPEALRRSAQLVAELAGDLGLVLIGSQSAAAWLWSPDLARELRQGQLARVARN